MRSHRLQPRAAQAGRRAAEASIGDFAVRIAAPAARPSLTRAALVIRTIGAPASILPVVRNELRATDPLIPMMGTATMVEHVQRDVECQSLVGPAEKPRVKRKVCRTADRQKFGDPFY